MNIKKALAVTGKNLPSVLLHLGFFAFILLFLVGAVGWKTALLIVAGITLFIIVLIGMVRWYEWSQEFLKASSNPQDEYISMNKSDLILRLVERDKAYENRNDEYDKLARENKDLKKELKEAKELKQSIVSTITNATSRFELKEI